MPEYPPLLPVHASRREARREAQLTGDPDVLIVARVEAPKDPEVALRAFAALLERRPGARLTWATLGGRDLPELRARLERDRGLARRVDLRVAVPQAQMPALYAGADVLLHTSRREVCGAAFVEALHAGLPVAASDIPAFRTNAAPGATVLVPAGDATRFAEAALALVEAGPAARHAARTHAAAHLTAEAIAARKLAAYRAFGVAVSM